MLSKLKKEVLEANLNLVKYGLVILTWGNVSGIDRKNNLIVIKPSGIEYDKIKISDMVVVDLEGNIVEGKKRPSSDTLTHVEIYKFFPQIGGITHTHSNYATIFSQACRGINCIGTTHADHFNGTIPVTRFLTKAEVQNNYELNTGKLIVSTLKNTNPLNNPAILVAGHAPFVFGKNAYESVKNSLILERIAEMNLKSYQLNPNLKDLPKYISDKHYNRKHGPDSYYGQK
ncbi:MAG: L-ribulose-5-phosphate 4-epimerase AraD [Ignavibacteriae bacterium]|nr:L-ribulose-5-phosphate 4-epimerase AraD [Ignavibacteriota bacterium]